MWPVLDVLNELPIDVVETNIWSIIGNHGSFRQACVQSRQLANSLITEVGLDDSRHGPHYDPTQLRLAGDELEAWHHDADQRSKFLSRLPRLTSLSLDLCGSETLLASLITKYGEAPAAV